MTPPIPPYYRQLLDAAARYRAEREYAVAVIVAQTACELVGEWAFETFFRAYDLTEAEKKGLVGRNYNLGNDRVRALYVLLSGDKIARTAFWSDFVAHTKRRHAIVHKGQKVTAKEAEASIRAATELIGHVESVVARASER